MLVRSLLIKDSACHQTNDLFKCLFLYLCVPVLKTLIYMHAETVCMLSCFICLCCDLAKSKKKSRQALAVNQDLTIPCTAFTCMAF